MDENENEYTDKNRIRIINEIFSKFSILTNLKPFEDLPPSYVSKKQSFIEEILKSFDALREEEVAFILYSFTSAKDQSEQNLINFLDTINSILSHYDYYQQNEFKTVKCNNSHFENYLLKRYECADVFTNYITSQGGRELKINNKLYFNYIPVKCLKESHTGQYSQINDKQDEIENCPFAHGIVEETYHPFVYKKFKCHKNGCIDKNCFLYHESIKDDMETEVDFDSDEMLNLQNVLSSSKEDIKITPKDSGNFIPSEFNPSTYKIYKCPLGPICKLDKKLCLNYHGPGDKRRNPNSYKAKLCPNLYEHNKKKKDGKCDLGDDCDCAHNLYEYYYHPKKFRTVKCPQEKKSKYCRERLICPYLHETDTDCGRDGVKIIVDERLITDYYKSLLVSYEKSIDSEMDKYKEIKKSYFCYICKNRTTCALDKEVFYVDTNQNRIVCKDCAKKNKINYIERGWY